MLELTGDQELFAYSLVDLLAGVMSVQDDAALDRLAHRRGALAMSGPAYKWPSATPGLTGCPNDPTHELTSERWDAAVGADTVYRPKCRNRYRNRKRQAARTVVAKHRKALTDRRWYLKHQIAKARKRIDDLSAELDRLHEELAGGHWQCPECNAVNPAAWNACPCQQIDYAADYAVQR